MTCELGECQNEATVYIANLEINTCQLCFEELGPFANGFVDEPPEEPNEEQM
jgi:hypothetical protein